MTAQPPRPTVSVSGGPAPTVSRDLLDTGPDQDVDGRHASRRRIAAGLGGWALLVALGGTTELRDRRADAAAAQSLEQRERSAVDLVLLDDWSGSSSYDAGTDRISYQVRLKVRNDGPRTVQVLAIGLPGVQLGSAIALDAGSERVLLLQGLYSCTGRGPQPAPDSVPFQVRTDAGSRPVELPIPVGMFPTDPLAEACQQARSA